MKNIAGLTEKEVRSRLKKFGYNEIIKKQESVLKHLLKKMWSPIPWMIESAAILSIVARKWDDFFFVPVVVIFGRNLIHH